jgi:hypothetical protein
VFYEVDWEALALLRAAKEHHDRLEPGEALADGTRVPGVDLYRITERGLEMLEES